VVASVYHHQDNMLVELLAVLQHSISREQTGTTEASSQIATELSDNKIVFKKT